MDFRLVDWFEQAMTWIFGIPQLGVESWNMWAKKNQKDPQQPPRPYRTWEEWNSKIQSLTSADIIPLIPDCTVKADPDTLFRYFLTFVPNGNVEVHVSYSAADVPSMNNEEIVCILKKAPELISRLEMTPQAENFLHQNLEFSIVLSKWLKNSIQK